MRQVKLLIIALLLVVGGTVAAQTKSEVQEVLEQFCTAYYDNFFAPRQYVVGTLRVTSIDIDKANEKIRVRGTHTCRGRHVPLFGRKTYEGREFKAEIMPARSGLRVKFWRWYAPDLPRQEGYWEGPCEKSFIPD
ncbi:MAG: hypothetical protein II887_05395 [Bacteroidales bacterium]|nr:hypothetical protein [Bacteroidales bacterium]